MDLRRFAIVLAVLLVPAVSHADCAGEFSELLHSNLSRGPYESRTQMVVRNKEGAVLRESDVTRQVVFPDSLRVVSGNPSSPAGRVEEVLIGGAQWLRKGSKWETVPGTPLKETLDRIRRNGFLSIPIGNVQCSGLTSYQGRMLLGFTSEAVQDGTSFVVTLYVDPSTRLPVLSKESVTGKLDMKTETIFRFAPDLSIKAPRD